VSRSAPPRGPHSISFRVADGFTLAADAFGDPAAAPVVLLHGGGQTRHAWGGTAAALAAEGWYAIALDMRGHGESERAPDGDYSIEAFARDLTSVAGTLRQPPVAVGASLGGLASLLAAGESSHPVVSAVVLVDIAPRMEAAGVERIVGFMRAHPEGFASLEEAADVVAAFTPHRPRPRDLNGLRKNLRLGSDGRWRWHWDERMMSGDRPPNAIHAAARLEAAARALRVPALLVRGRMSDVVSEEGARAFLALVPHARYADVSGAGHMVAGDRNDPFTDAVLGFLSTEVRPALRA
jgi:pimeloyl-ACP methyl ester carboxylesterase